MRTWNGTVEVIADTGDVLGRAHADLAGESGRSSVQWWGELRGAGGFGLTVGQRVRLRLAEGSEAEVEVTEDDPHDVYHRIDVRGTGDPPF